MDQPSFTPLVIAAILYVVLTIIALWIGFVILKRLIRKIGEVWSHAHLFGTDQKTRLISLGIAVILFPGVLFSLANAILFFIGNIFVEAPRSLLNNWLNAQSVCLQSSPDSLGRCFGELSFGFIQAWTSAFSNALERFGPGYLPYNQLILMLAVWAIAALLLGEAPASEGDGQGENIKMRLQNAIDRLSRPARQNIMFFLILVLAGYLSIAAIAAIPGLQEPAVTSEAISVERLEEQLTEALTQSQVHIAQPLELSDPFAEIDQKLTEALTPLQAGMTTPEPGSQDPEAALEAFQNDLLIEDIKADLDSLKISRQLLLETYPQLQSEVQSQATTAMSSAVNAYRASLIGRKGTQQTVQHFLSLSEWFRRALTRHESQVNSCRIRLRSLDLWFGYRINEILYPSQFNVYQSPNETSPIDSVRESCTLSSELEPPPARPDLGSNLGPFSYVASWLLRTESLPLAQIVGLLGFGLLGSAVSTLVRSDAKRRRNQPLVDELATVIIRGATAAVVVFLAVKGGLAIFTSGESDPNSYVLLLTCLIAAVFSEDVWTEAHKRLNKSLNAEEIPLKPDTDPAPEIPSETEKAGDTSTPDEESSG